MKRIAVFLCILNCLFLLTGCWDRKELSEIKLVAGMAIDKGEDGKYKVTVEALNAAELNTQSSAGNAPTVVEGIEGDSISEITHLFNEYYAQILIYSHMKVLVISEEVASAGRLDFIDFLERNREIRDDFNIIIAKDGKAEDILKIAAHYRKASSLKLSPQLDHLMEDWGGDPGMNIINFISELNLEGKEPVLATVRLKGDVEKGMSMKNIQKVTPDAIVVVDSLAIFKDGKLVGFLSLEDTRNYLWTRNDIKTTSLTLECKKGDFSAIRVTESQTEVTSKMKNGKPFFHVSIKAEGFIEGTQCYNNVEKLGTIAKYEKLINETFSKKITDTITKVQKQYQADIFGFGEVMRRQDFNSFMKVKDNWSEEFASGDVKVDMDFVLRRSGIRSKSFLTETEK
ncbi:MULTISPECIES: Ger(x)C family spore germination protein [Bacillaceae]|uniref:Ger(x)C family spore germination protein n=1 Tax=Bacillaceae TaxID=186817 RepID=UPI0004E18C57|nr:MULTISPECIES: Ger(x)C family spore germination protein [Bacillaceae]MCM3361172.1 Ger(x)C family spore germination protein [Niallia sp. MER TA 168]CAI9390410.1 Spore germination protein B3 [Bacillus sp. T2.9-1]